MKNASKHAEDLKALKKRLTRQFKPPPKQKLEPLDALVRAAMSFDVADERAEQAVALINREFVDLNELRVATDLEIQELLGARYPEIERRVAMITQSLNAIFEREDTLSLERLKTISKKDARQFMRELPDIHPFVEAYVMLFAFDAAAIPLDGVMLDYLKRQKAIEPEIGLDEAQRFIENHFRASEHYDFYCGVRQAAGGTSRGATRAATTSGTSRRKRTRTKAKA